MYIVANFWNQEIWTAILKLAIAEGTIPRMLDSEQIILKKL
jgi:prolipoprotein diacylglyceryltransferase